MGLLKLHGSLNWARCPRCGDIQTVAVNCFDKFIGADPRGDEVFLNIADRCQSSEHCALRREIAIVPPTWNKTQHYAEIGRVWRTAATKLAEAENIIIIGYSLPPTDQFFRYLFALGTIGEARLQRVWVFDPDESVDAKYRELLGPMARDRYELVTGENGKFSACIKILGQRLKVSEQGTS